LTIDPCVFFAENIKLLLPKVEDFFGAISAKQVGDKILLAAFDVINEQETEEGEIFISLDELYVFDEGAELELSFKELTITELEVLFANGATVEVT